MVTDSVLCSWIISRGECQWVLRLIVKKEADLTLASVKAKVRPKCVSRKKCVFVQRLLFLKNH